MSSNIFDVEEHLLFALYYIGDLTEKANTYYCKLISILNENKEEILKSSKLQDLIIKIYNKIISKDKSIFDKLLELLDNQHKKIALCNMDIDKQIESKYSKEEIELMIKDGNIKENIKKILEYLISFYY